METGDIITDYEMMCPDEFIAKYCYLLEPSDLEALADMTGD